MHLITDIALTSATVALCVGTVLGIATVLFHVMRPTGYRSGDVDVAFRNASDDTQWDMLSEEGSNN